MDLIATAYSCPHAFGWLPAADGTRPETPLTIERWMDLAAARGLRGVEIPLREEQSAPEALARLRDAAEARGLIITVSGGMPEAAELRRLIGAARAVSGMERPVVRAILSRVLCGDRRGLEGGWSAHLEGVLARLREIVPEAREAGVSLALENHQDATSEDLIALCEAAGPDVVGICLDTGNPLAVGEDPVEFASRVAPYVRHVHLKDYTIHFAPSGYRLVRCAAGDGVIDFPAILKALRASPHPLRPGIEVGAQMARLIPILDAGWWAEYPPRPAIDALPALRILWERGRPADAEWRTPWERGEPSAAILGDEMSTFERSVDYFAGLTL